MLRSRRKAKHLVRVANRFLVSLAVTIVVATGIAGRAPAEDPSLSILFLGDQGHHQPARRFAELQPHFESRKIDLRYTEDMSLLRDQSLEPFDGILLYANIDTIEPARADAVRRFVEGGKGFLAIHCASYCWRNSDAMVEMIGGQFLRHGTGTFQTQLAMPDHPIMKGFGGFRSWDETYVHHRHHEDGRTVLEFRVDRQSSDSARREPWTWVRDQGDGRVFYTAWGHDHRTFTHPGFQNLLERGIRWACGADPTTVPEYRDPDRRSIPPMTASRTDVAPFEYEEVGPKIPNYTASEKWGTQGDPIRRMQKPLPAIESMKHFVTPESLEVHLYADEQTFDGKPIAMTWDARGRLWVCETVDYPNELGLDRDRIRICEDADGDGVADHSVVFADGLSIPTSIVITHGGAVVQNGTETIFLRDEDGDDVADTRQTLIRGWALGDTHGGVSNLRYGLDNWIWGMQGYNDSRPEFEGSSGQSFRQGFFRFKLSDDDLPTVTDLEFVRSTNNNTWGLGISEDGLIFGSTANHNPSMFMPIPNRYYERVRGMTASTLHSIADSHRFDPITKHVRQVDHHGGYTAAAGHAIYTARAFNPSWWNRTAFVCGPTGHLVGTFLIEPDGFGFRSSSPFNLLASDDEWSAPIMAEVGPDGAIWVIDWYNYIVQHNPTPNGFETGAGRAYESDLRDKRHGRIYRVAPGERSRWHSFDSLDSADPASVVRALGHPSMRWRLHAQRLLVESGSARDQSVQERLLDLVLDPTVDPTGLAAGAIHALWVLADIADEPSPDAIDRVLSAGLSHPSAGVRRNALAVLPRFPQSERTLRGISDGLNDPHPQVQLQAALTAADVEKIPGIAEELIKQIAATDDPIATDALTIAAAVHHRDFLSTVLAATADPRDVVLDALRVVAAHAARQPNHQDVVREVLSDLGSAPSAVRTAVLTALADSLPQSRTALVDSSTVNPLRSLFDVVPNNEKVLLLRLADRLGSDALDAGREQLTSSLAASVQDEQLPDSQRVSAAAKWMQLTKTPQRAAEIILSQIQPQTSPETAKRLLQSVGESAADAVGPALISELPRMLPQTKAAGITLLLSRQSWTAALIDAAESGRFHISELDLQQQRSLRAIDDPGLSSRIAAVLARAGGVPNEDRQRVLEELQHVIDLAGNRERGQAVFIKNCAACHQLGDLGQKVGPNLTGMAAHPKSEWLTHILDPSRNVEGNYRLYNLLTLDGVVLSGMLAGESKTTITIVDSTAKKHDVAREDIDTLVASRKSVMPEGFEKAINPQGFADLLTFLTDQGPYVPLPLDAVATAVSTRGLFHDGDDGPDRMIFQDWEPKMVGDVPFVLVDPSGKSVKNMVLLHGPRGALPPKMPRTVELPVGKCVQSVHLLSGVGGWSHPFDSEPTVSMTVRLNFADGESESHDLVNGVHFADYIRRVDVPKSEFAFALGSQQIRYLVVTADRIAEVDSIELIKGPDATAPIVMAVTIEQPADD